MSPVCRTAESLLGRLNPSGSSFYADSHTDHPVCRACSRQSLRVSLWYGWNLHGPPLSTRNRLNSEVCCWLSASNSGHRHQSICSLEVSSASIFGLGYLGKQKHILCDVDSGSSTVELFGNHETIPSVLLATTPTLPLLNLLTLLAPTSAD